MRKWVGSYEINDISVHYGLIQDIRAISVHKTSSDKAFLAQGFYNHAAKRKCHKRAFPFILISGKILREM